MAANCIAQKRDDNTVIVHGNFSTAQIKTALFMSGFKMEGTDTTIISTTSKELAEYAYSIKLLLLRTDTAIFMKGLARHTKNITLFNATSNSDYQTLAFVTLKHSPERLAWNEMMKVAKELSNTISYIKQ